MNMTLNQQAIYPLNLINCIQLKNGQIVNQNL